MRDGRSGAINDLTAKDSSSFKRIASRQSPPPALSDYCCRYDQRFAYWDAIGNPDADGNTQLPGLPGTSDALNVVFKGEDGKTTITPELPLYLL